MKKKKERPVDAEMVITAKKLLKSLQEAEAAAQLSREIAANYQTMNAAFQQLVMEVKQLKAAVEELGKSRDYLLH